MTPRLGHLRHIVAALLTVVLLLIGAGRANLLADAQEIVPVTIDGVVLTICHTIDGEAPAAPDHASHDCCDACLTMTPAVLPSPPAIGAPRTVAALVAHDQTLTWRPRLARLKTPRQSQGPPAA